MTILITGGAGFIGSHVADAYLDAGHKVVVVDDLSSGKRENLDSRVIFYEKDIRDESLDAIFEREKPDIVNHHAAQISVPRSVSHPKQDADVNILGLINVLDSCVKHQVKKIIFISSGGAIYGEAEEYPTTENYLPQPLSVYAINKYAGEHYLRFYHHQYGLNYTVLRYSNVFGPRQMPEGEAGVVSIFVEKLLRDEIPNLYAYPDEPDGMIRDYVYVKDVVRANLAVLDKGDNEAFNIGTCIETTTLHLYRTILWQLGKKIQPKCGPARQGDLRRSMLDISKAFSELGWSPLYSLEDGVRETIEFFKEKGKVK